MSLPYTSVSTQSLPKLESTLEVLLSPLDFPDWKSWQKEAHARLLELTNADSLCMFTPLSTGADAWLSPHLAPSTLNSYAAKVAANPEWDIIENGFARFTEESGESVAHETDFITPAELDGSEFFQEFLLPNGILDLTVAGTHIGGSEPARLHFGNETRRSLHEKSQRKALVRTVMPAFRSSLAQWQQLGERRVELGRMLDSLPDAILLFDTTGTLVHANPSANQILSLSGKGSSREINGLSLEAERLAWSIGSLGRKKLGVRTGTRLGTPGVISAATALADAAREIRIDGKSFSLRASLAPAWMLGREPGVLITIERSSRSAPSQLDLQAQYGLTAREAEVARLIGSGLSNQALAERLGVSFFTARNHVERVLSKMGAMNRSHVGAMTRGEQLAS